MTNTSSNDVDAALKWLKGSWQAADNRSEAANAAAVIEAMAAVGVRQEAEIERLQVALRYWLPDEAMIPEGHELAWNEHVELIPEHRSKPIERTYPDHPVAGIYEAGIGVWNGGTKDEGDI